MESSIPLICPVCNHSDFQNDFVCTDFFVTGRNFTLLRCKNCGFRITGSAPSPDESEKYYQSEDYISHSNTRKGFTNKAYHFIREYMLRKKASIIPAPSGEKPGALLDIGAGTGFFLNFMHHRGWKVTGTEKSAGARSFALKEWQLSLLSEEALFTLPFCSFDVVTLWHVLEHLHNLQEHLSVVAQLIKPQGSLVIAVPNPESSDATHYREYWAAWDVPRHLWHFTPENISTIIQKYGFTPPHIYRMPFDAFYVSILSEKYKKSSSPLVRGLIRGFVSWTVSLFRPLKCSSLIYVFKKK
jgi:SAM-dependent methyltransferase